MHAARSSAMNGSNHCTELCSEMRIFKEKECVFYFVSTDNKMLYQL